MGTCNEVRSATYALEQSFHLGVSHLRYLDCAFVSLCACRCFSAKLGRIGIFFLSAAEADNERLSISKMKPGIFTSVG